MEVILIFKYFQNIHIITFLSTNITFTVSNIIFTVTKFNLLSLADFGSQSVFNASASMQLMQLRQLPWYRVFTCSYPQEVGLPAS